MRELLPCYFGWLSFLPEVLLLHPQGMTETQPHYIMTPPSCSLCVSGALLYVSESATHSLWFCPDVPGRRPCGGGGQNKAEMRQAQFSIVSFAKMVGSYPILANTS